MASQNSFIEKGMCVYIVCTIYNLGSKCCWEQASAHNSCFLWSLGFTHSAPPPYWKPTIQPPDALHNLIH